MPLLSLTRLRVRSPRHLPAFGWRTLRSARQARRAPGYLGGGLLADKARVFWTMTAWEDIAAMRSFRNSGAHRDAMPSLLDACDEASYVHWDQPETSLPSWADAYARLAAAPLFSKVRAPSADHAARVIPAPRRTRGLNLRPKA